MSESTELDVVIARPLITADQAAEAASELRQMIAKVLVKDKHYQKIRGRDVLLKAGAEELQRVFGLNFTYSELDTFRDPETGMFQAMVKCSVRNQLGTILAESYGYFHQNEKMGQKGGPPGPNTIIKMAQKRAYVGAIMSATGTSELFTQDLEDEEQPPSRPPAPSTPDERLLLAELFAQKGGGTIVAAREWLDARPKRGERDWVANRVLDLLLRPDPKNGGPEKNLAEEVSAQSEDEYQAGLPDEVEPELPPDPPTIEVEVEEESNDTPF